MFYHKTYLLKTFFHQPNYFILKKFCICKKKKNHYKNQQKITSNCDKTQKLKLWQLKNSNCDNSKTKIVTTQIVTKFKLEMWQIENSNCDQNQIVTKLNKNQTVTKFNSNCDKT